MSLIEKNREPTARDMKWFGLLFAIFFTLAGMLLWWRTRSAMLWIYLGTIGCLVAALYYAVPPMRRTIYLVWTAAVYPIGWGVSHLLLIFTYYLVLTPIGWAMRAAGRDPLRRRFEPEAATYWIEHDPTTDPKRYFRQF
jgi:hypothetical protein